MKKIFNIIFTASLVLGLASCDKIFDSLEGDLSKMYAEDLTATEAGMDRLLASLYSNIPMNAFAEAEKGTMHAGETSGNTNISEGVSSFWNYTAIRDMNSFIKQIDAAKERGVITEAAYNNYLGEVKFIRAYCYFASVRTLGGVPIVTEMLDDKYEGDDKENAGLYIPRSTEKETWDFVLKELDEAAALLPDDRGETNYRATKWAALGLKARAALWAASVSKYWNEAKIESDYEAVAKKLTYMEASYADAYYQQCIDACEQIINSGRFSLYMPLPKDVEEAVENYTELFQARHKEEFIYGRSYNNGVATNSNGIDLKNSPNQIHGSGTGVWKFGCYGVTLDMVDLYDNYDASFNAVDGKIKTVNGEEKYYVQPRSEVGINAIKADGDKFIVYDNVSDPFKDKDARFLASVMYPGIKFRDTDIIIQAGIWEPNGVGYKDDKLSKPCDGELHIMQDANPAVYLSKDDVYYSCGAVNESYFSGFFKIGNTNDGAWYTTGFGIRKFLNPDKAVSESQNPWYDIRYTEVLLNYCEAQVEKNGTNAGKSKEYLNAIRRRANFRDQREATLENVLHEREVELAFEDDYNRTLYRRRAYFVESRDIAKNPNAGRKHALLPILDMRDGTPKYIFVRANWFAMDTDRMPGLGSYNPLNYYGSISNYVTNKIVKNPIQGK
ncbi:MAG: RagB/SusD family nutrient uptake outer membrane protein [Bacteroidales bacterium]|nr:RagB/SusD family nutrient uptake outer membrane protein [Bacteroidales bacterium]